MPHGISKHKNKINCLDGLRGLAVILVILFHLYGHRRREYGTVVDRVLRNFWFGYCGVNLFLVLSGFCLTLSLLRKDAAGKPLGLGSFFKGRAWRIVPPYYASILLYLAVPLAWRILEGRASNDLTTWQLVTHASFLHGYDDETLFAICVSYWSLSLEMQFYLALPLLYEVAKRRGCWPVLMFVAAISLGWNLWARSIAPGSLALRWGIFPGRWTEFALGMAVAFWYERSGWKGASATRVSSALSALFLALALGVGYTEGHIDPISLNYLYGAGFAMLLMATLSSGIRGGRLARMLEWPWIVRAGEMSYSLYLTHVLIQGKTSKLCSLLVPNPNPAAEIGLVLVNLAAIFAGGWLFYVLVESHFQRSVGTKRESASMRMKVLDASRSLVPAARH
jgi:peptidoglycan/LPS O-acetylase OafA/YrhL